MRLTAFSDYALRVLMYARANGDRLVTIEETARTYGISRAHLMKVVNILTRAGYVQAVRGRSGGFRVAMAPEDINLGAVVRATEPDFALVECFAPGNRCVITRHCGLPNVLNEALRAYLGVLDNHTLADIPIARGDFDPPDGTARPRRGPEFTVRREVPLTNPGSPSRLPDVCVEDEHP